MLKCGIIFLRTIILVFNDLQPTHTVSYVTFNIYNLNAIWKSVTCWVVFAFFMPVIVIVCYSQ